MHCGQAAVNETPADSSRLSQLTAVAPKTFVQKMRSTQRVKTAPPPGAMGERRTVTTLLADVVGSTGLADELNLETWMELMNNAFNRIAPIIYHYEGTIVRLLGDSLLTFFGAPVAHEDDPQRAVRAGLEIIAQMGEYAKEIKQAHGVDFAMRVCINTGPVEIGPLGEDLTLEYTAFGGTVNLTSRIKFASSQLSVLVTENTYRFIAPYFDCLDFGPVEVKGMSEAVRVYQVMAAREILGRTRGFTDLESPIVGRNSELTTLLNMCEAVRVGLGRAVLIVGEPGLGKTRLIQEWQKAAQVENDIFSENQSIGKLPKGRWLTGRCVSYKQGMAYQLSIDLLKNVLGMTVGSDEPETRAALMALTRDLFGEQMMDVYPYLGHLLSLKLEGKALERSLITDPQALQTQYLLATRRLLHELMKQTPLIMVLEDLHWADASSTELIISLLPYISGEPILLCLVTRPESDTPGWKLVNATREQMRSSLAEITLNALSENDTRMLVSNLLEVEALPERVRDLVLKKAEGNPFFVEEVIRMLIERGAIFHQEGSWVALQEISEHDIPDNLQGLLLGRIDRLPAEARYTALVASVIGRNFPVKVLSQVMQRSIG
jgi:class 3 adenylate cyclase